MDVKAINSISLTPKYESGMKKTANNESAQSYPQMNSPMSKVAAKAIENSAMVSFGERHNKHPKSHTVRNAIIAGIFGLGTLGMTSCNKSLISVEEDAWAEAQSDAYAWAKPAEPIIINDTIRVHDTDTIVKIIYKPVKVKEYPWHIADSLIRQGLNINTELDGPIPGDVENHVAFVGATAYNEYDYSLYETHLDSIGTNAKTLSLVTKVTKMYDDSDPSVSIHNPKITYFRTEATDVPGVGIQLSRKEIPEEYIRPEDINEFPESSDFRFRKDMGYEVRTNNRNGKSNSARIYNGEYNKILPEGRKVEYIRGNEMGQLLFGTEVYDKDGHPYIGPDGNPEYAYYDYSNAKVVSKEIKFNPEDGTYEWKP